MNWRRPKNRKTAPARGISGIAVPDQPAFFIQFLKYDLVFLQGKAGAGERASARVKRLFPKYIRGDGCLYDPAGKGTCAC